MEFSLSEIIASLVFSIIGIWLFREAKRKNNLPLIIISMLLMTYSLFINNIFLNWGVGFLLCYLAYEKWE